MVADGRDLPDLPALLSGHERRDARVGSDEDPSGLIIAYATQYLSAAADDIEGTNLINHFSWSNSAIRHSDASIVPSNAEEQVRPGRTARCPNQADRVTICCPMAQRRMKPRLSFALLKRCITVYCNEFSFRWNERKTTARGGRGTEPLP